MDRTSTLGNGASSSLLIGLLCSASLFVSAYCWRELRKLQSELETKKPNKPKYIVLLRHGESEANVNHSLYSSIGDPNICLTKNGRAQAVEVGKRLSDLAAGRKVFVYISPYKRTMQTAEFLLSQLSEGTIHKQIIDPRLREREFSGTFQPAEGLDRIDEQTYSRFFWRPPCGESCADVYDRMSLFIDTLWRDFKRHPEMKDSVVVLVSHGLTTRLFLMRWLHWTIDIFNSTTNPNNGDMMILERVSSSTDEYFVLLEDSLKLLGIHETFSELKRLTKPGLRPVPNYAVVNKTFRLDRKTSHHLIPVARSPRRRSSQYEAQRLRAASDGDATKLPGLAGFGLEALGEEDDVSSSEEDVLYPYSTGSHHKTHTVKEDD